MQAGESLSFITVPEELSIKEAQPKVERETVREEFVLFYKLLIEKHRDSFRSMEVMEESGPVMVHEGSFQLPFADGSYLHLVPYSLSDEEGFLSIGLSIVEHTHEGKYVGGYSYVLAEDDVQYSYQGAAEDEDEDEQFLHFSVIDARKQSEEVFQMQMSEDEAMRSLAEVVRQELEEAEILGAMERELGFSMSYPTIEDMQKLKALVNLVSPFEVPQR